MAAGSVVSRIQSIAASGTYDIKPQNVGEEWVIHNIRYGGQIKLSVTDGANVLDYDSDTSAGARLGLADHVNQMVWLRITNTGSTAVLVEFDGVQTSA